MDFYTQHKLESIIIKKKLPVVFICLASLFFAGCVTPKNSYYFKNLPRDTSINTTVNRLSESLIRKNDQLSINISSLNPQEDQVYNAAAISGSSTSLPGAAGSGGYLVDMNGNIQLHRLGTVKAEGLTRRELKNKIETDIKPYLKDPVVTVKYMNHRVTVIGEIAKPQVIPMPEEQLSVLEVLGAGGDITPLGKRDNILIIRETETGKQFKRLNMEDKAVFTSEWYYLKPDDVVYIEPNDVKIKEAKRVQKQQNISLILSGASVVLIILSRLIK
jgi:polysaccharide biosynthesis/export protein